MWYPMKVDLTRHGCFGNEQIRFNFKIGEKYMSRYTGPTWKVSRRLGFSLSETGKELRKRPYPPGQHGQNRRRKQSNYGLQLQEKQKLRFLYGLSEKQFKNLFQKASK